MTRGCWSQLPVNLSMLVFAVLLTIAFPDSTGRAEGRGGGGGQVAGGSVRSGHTRTTIRTSLQSIAFRGNGSRKVHEELRKLGIIEQILTLTGRKNGTIQTGQTNETQEEEEEEKEEEEEEEEQSRSHNTQDRVQGTTVPSVRTAPRIYRTSVKNTRESRVKEKIKFTPEEVSRDKNDVLVLFALYNYTDMEIDGAELLVLLRYRHLPANQSVGSRKPDVRRITISVFTDIGNSTPSGNASFVERSSMTTSLFQIRRTKWVKVMLKRSWIQEALTSPTRTLRLRLIYDKSSLIEVVTTSRNKSNRAQGKTNQKRMRAGTVVGGDRSRQLKELNGNRKWKMSPVLVVMKRQRSSS